MSGVVIFNSLTEDVNEISLTAGRLPRAGNEAVADAQFFPVDSIGKKIVLSETNDEDTLDMFAYREYTIVGLGNSPTYLNYERGSTSLGTGAVMAFAYIPYEGFDCDYYTDIYIRLDTEGEIYSDEYQAGVEQYEDSVTHSGESQARERFETLVGDAESELDDGVAEYDEGYTEYLEQRDEAERELLDALDEITAGRAEIIANEQLPQGQRAGAARRPRPVRFRPPGVKQRREPARERRGEHLRPAQCHAGATGGAARHRAETAWRRSRKAACSSSTQQLTEAVAQLESGVSQAQAARDATQRHWRTAARRPRRGGAVHYRSERAQKAERLGRAGGTARGAGGGDRRPRSRACHPPARRRRAHRRTERPACRAAFAARWRCRAALDSTSADYETRIAEAQATRDGLSTQATAAQGNVSALTTERDNALAPLQERACAGGGRHLRQAGGTRRPRPRRRRRAASPLCRARSAPWKAARAN